MPHGLCTLLVAITLGGFVGFAPCGDDLPKKVPAPSGARGNEDVFGHERFRVTIRPAKTEVRLGEKFDVKLRVVNSSNVPQAFKAWSCSWDVQWTWKNLRIHYGFDNFDCWRNGLQEVRLKPGEAYEKTMALKLVAAGKSKEESLRMGFTPGGERKTYWSNQVVLGMK